MMIKPYLRSLPSATSIFRVLLSFALYFSSSISGYALIFNFTPATGTPGNVIAGFQAAGQRWSAQLSDNVTINLNIAFTTLALNVLGSTSARVESVSYGVLRTALNEDRTSGLDNVAVANLPLSSVGMLLNRTSDHPNGSGSPLPAIDNNGSANNTTIRATFANLKALGLLSATNPAVDASISFNSSFPWDYDRSNGITPGTLDFVGIAAHEIGHALGFISGVDVLDANSPPANGPLPSNTFTYVSPLDLFRFSNLSTANNVIDWTADMRTKFFSIDRGLTIGATFSTGTNFGDGRQASHWKDALGLGIMDPATRAGEILAFTENDLRAMDAIGWNRIPDTGSTLLQLGLALGVLAAMRQRAAHR